MPLFELDLDDLVVLDDSLGRFDELLESAHRGERIKQVMRLPDGTFAPHGMGHELHHNDRVELEGRGRGIVKGKAGHGLRRVVLDDGSEAVVHHKSPRPPDRTSNEWAGLLAGPMPLAAAREPGWLKRIILEEGATGYVNKKYDEQKHPRWPKGTPRAGQFMRSGQMFSKDGHRWQIVTAVKGKIYATEASGKASEVKEISLDATPVKDGTGVEIKGISEATPYKIAGGGSAVDEKGVTGENSPVVDPYVKPETHDSSIAIPPESKLSAQDWQRFGEEDQRYYAELMDRFGAWKPSQAQSMMETIYYDYDSAVRSVFDNAYGSQYGGSGFWPSAGQWLNLAYLFNHTGKGQTPQLKTAWAQYEKCKTAMDEMNELVHWDLYNRTKAPDITLMHGGSGMGQGVKGYQKNFIEKGTPIYAGFSQSAKLSGAESWGSSLIATPVAIKHVALSEHAMIPPQTGMKGEHEIAVGVRMKLDDRSVAFDSSTMGAGGYAATQAIKKWFHKTEQQPASGEMVQQLKDIWAGKGVIPIPEEPLNLHAVSDTDSGWKPLPDAIAKQAGAMAHSLKYKSDDGSKEAAVGKIDGMGLKPGDFIEGKQGTRYVIIVDTGDSSNGLRYVKIEPGTLMPNYQKSFQFSTSAGNDFYRLDGHIDIPIVKEAGYVGWTADDMAKLAQGEKKPLAEFKPGDIFKASQVGFEGQGFKVIGPAGGGQIQVESLDNGKKFTASAAHKTPIWVPMEGFVAPTQEQELTPAWEVGDPVIVSIAGTGSLAKIAELTPTGAKVEFAQAPGSPVAVKLEQLKQAPPMPGIQASNAAELALKLEKGDKFALSGKTYTVTTVLKSGTVKAKPQDGPVAAIPPGEILQHAIVYRPSTFAIGGKAKVGDLEIGDLVQGGAGKTIRPYQIVGKGKKVSLLNLETGEYVDVGKSKSYRVLLDAKAIAAQATPEPSQPGVKTGVKLVKGKHILIKNLDVGDAYVGINMKADAGYHYVVTEKLADGGIEMVKVHTDGTVEPPTNFSAALLEMGEGYLMVPATPAQQEAKPELSSKFELGKWVVTTDVAPKDMEPGTIFLSSTGIPMKLLSNKPKLGATAENLETGKKAKGINYDNPLSLLVPKEDTPFDHSKLEIGELVLAGDLAPGDVFVKNDMKWTVTKPAVGDQMGTMSKLAGGKAIGFGSLKFAASEEVIYSGTLDDVQPSSPPVDIHADALPVPPDFETYLHPKSGKYHYPLVNSMAVGTVFTDKGGQPWKVKQTGGQTVITDGTNLYSVKSDWRGKLADSDVAFLDNASLPSEPDGSSGVTVGDLKEGDQFTVPAGYFGAGKVYEVLSTVKSHKAGVDASDVGAPNLSTNAYDTIAVKQISPGPGQGDASEIATSLKPAHIVTANEPPLPGLFQPTGPNIVAGDLPKFEFAKTAAGKLVYKGSNGKLWYVGTNTNAQVKKVQPVSWTGPTAPDAAMLKPSELVPLEDLQPGDFFLKNGKGFQVAAVGPEGITGWTLPPQAHYVAFAAYSSGKEVNKAEVMSDLDLMDDPNDPPLPPDEPAPEVSGTPVADAQDVKVGDVIKVQVLGDAGSTYTVIETTGTGITIVGPQGKTYPYPHETVQHLLDKGSWAITSSAPPVPPRAPLKSGPESFTPFVTQGELPDGTVFESEHGGYGTWKVGSDEGGKYIELMKTGTLGNTSPEDVGHKTYLASSAGIPIPESWSLVSLPSATAEPDPPPPEPIDFSTGYFFGPKMTMADAPEGTYFTSVPNLKDLHKPIAPVWVKKGDHIEYVHGVSAGTMGGKISSFSAAYFTLVPGTAPPEPVLTMWDDVPIGAQFKGGPMGTRWKKVSASKAEVIEPYETGVSAWPKGKQSAWSGSVEVLQAPKRQGKTGEKVGDISKLTKGMVFGTGGMDGSTFVVVDPKSPKNEFVAQVLKHNGVLQPGDNVEWPYLDAKSYAASSWVWKEKPGAAKPPAPKTPEPSESPLKPYLHAKSGKYKYPKLGAIGNGTKFKDKTGKVFTVTAAQNKPGKVAFLDSAGQVHWAPSDSHVKVV